VATHENKRAGAANGCSAPRHFLAVAEQRMAVRTATDPTSPKFVEDAAVASPCDGGITRGTADNHTDRVPSSDLEPSRTQLAWA
jgi:hypothetical protein